MKLDGSVPVKYGVRLAMDEKYKALKKSLSELTNIPTNQILLVEILGPVVKVSFPIVSSPEPSGSQGELTVYPYSGVRCRCRRRRCRQQCLNIFSETALPIKAKFYVELPWEGRTKGCINGPVHMTKMAAMPIYGKNLLLQNQTSYDLEIWHVALGTQALQSFYKWWPWLTLIYFMARSNLVPYAFVWEKGKTMDFSETIVVYDLKLATDDWNNKKFLLTSKLCPLGAVCPCPGAIYMY